MTEWQPGDVVAVRAAVRSLTIGGNYLLGGDGTWIANDSVNIAPWVDAEEQALMEAVIEAGRELIAGGHDVWLSGDVLDAAIDALDDFRRAKKETP